MKHQQQHPAGQCRQWPGPLTWWPPPFLPLRDLQLTEPWLLEAARDAGSLSLCQPPNSCCSPRLRLMALARAMAKPSSAPTTAAPMMAWMAVAEMPGPPWPASVMDSDAGPAGVLPLVLLAAF